MSFGRLGRAQASQPISEINVTPLVDVMLVLLVIFMLAAPLLGTALQLELPRAQASAAPPAASLRLEVDAAGQLRLDGLAVDRDQLRERLRQAAVGQSDTELQLLADQALPYGRVVELMDLAQQAGLSRIGFVAQPGR